MFRRRNTQAVRRRQAGGWAVVIALLCAGISLPLAAQIPFVIPVLGQTEMDIPGGTSMVMEDLDGVIGPEWSDSLRTTMRLGKYSATVYQKRDQTHLFLAMVIETNRRFSRGFEAFLIIDDGDGQDYERGDDMMLVQAGGHAPEDADYYYRDLYDYRLDQRSAGRTNAYGIGVYDEAAAHYVFEFMRELESGDPRDRPLCTGCNALVIYGWASY